MISNNKDLVRRSPAGVSLPLAAVVAAANLLAAGPVFGQGAAGRPDFTFALVRYDGGNWNPRPTGLVRMAWEVRRRTSIAVSLDIAAVDPSQDGIFDFPLLVWQGDQAFRPFSEAAILRLRQHLTMGGTLLVDVSDGVVDGPFHRCVKRELLRIFVDQAPKRVSTEHVLYQSFYLLDRHGGRVPARSYLTGIFVADRLAVIISTNDLAGAVARDEFGEWEYDVGAGGQAAREMTFRLAINAVMYALCLNYKKDQVHVEYILRRRR